MTKCIQCNPTTMRYYQRWRSSSSHHLWVCSPDAYDTTPSVGNNKSSLVGLLLMWKKTFVLLFYCRHTHILYVLYLCIKNVCRGQILFFFWTTVWFKRDDLSADTAIHRVNPGHTSALPCPALPCLQRGVGHISARTPNLSWIIPHLLQWGRLLLCRMWRTTTWLWDDTELPIENIYMHFWHFC